MKKVLFETHHLYYWPNFLPVVEELVKRKGYVINVSIPKRSSSLQENILSNSCFDLGIPFITADTEEERISKISKEKYDMIIVGNIGQLKQIITPETLVVMVYNGIGLKQSYYNDIDDRIDIRSVESMERFNELKIHGHDNLSLTGFTKLDRLFTLSDDKVDEIRSILKIDSTKKTLLYAPSFYPTSIDRIHHFLPELSKDHNVIIKLHGFSWEQKKYYYQNIICQELAKENQGIHLLSNEDYDIIPYYRIADMLITDISSTMFEFLPMDRPIIQAQCYDFKLKHRIFKNRFWRKMDINRQKDVDFAYQISDPEDLLGRVYYAIDNMDEMSLKRIDASKNYLYKTDGKASHRLVDAIENY